MSEKEKEEEKEMQTKRKNKSPRRPTRLYTPATEPGVIHELLQAKPSWHNCSLKFLKTGPSDHQMLIEKRALELLIKEAILRNHQKLFEKRYPEL